MKKHIFKKFIISILITLTALFTFSSCVLSVSDGAKLNAPVIALDENKEIVYWASVAGADKYYVSINDNVETVKYTFCDLSNLPAGEYAIKVKAVPSKIGDTQSNYSNVLNILVTDDDNDGGNSSENVDYEEVINGVTQTAMQANFTVYLTSTKTFPAGQARSQGSGIIYKRITSGTIYNRYYTYYLLTNNHVIYKDTANYNTFAYTVTDKNNVEYQAEVVAYNPNYDLAVVKFTSETVYEPLALASTNSKAGDKVIALGQPKGQKNAITFGEILGLATPTITVDPNTEMSNVKFEVYRHNAPINSGSSGGALINYNYEIVGLNYASSTDANGNYVSSFAVPVLKIKEFLTANNLA